MPATMARWSMSAGMPDAPCSDSGWGTLARISARRCPVELGRIAVDAVHVADRDRQAVGPRRGHELDGLAGSVSAPAATASATSSSPVMPPSSHSTAAPWPAGQLRARGERTRRSRRRAAPSRRPSRRRRRARARPRSPRGRRSGRAARTPASPTRRRRRAARPRSSPPRGLGERAAADQQDHALAARSGRLQHGRRDLQVVARERAHGGRGRRPPAARRTRPARQPPAPGSSRSTSSASSPGPPTLPGTTR